MSDPGFQLDEAQFTSGEGDYGGAASPGYGDDIFGGQDYNVWKLPPVHVGSDDLTSDMHYRVGESTHRRGGLYMGSRKYGEKRRWRIVWNPITQDDMDTLVTYFKARVFRLVPDWEDEAVYIRVHWVETKFAPVSLRGGWWRIQFTIEET